MRRTATFLFTVVVLTAYAVGFLTVRRDLEWRHNRIRLNPPEARAAIPQAALVPLSLRFREALADLFWVHALLYFGFQSEQHHPPLALADIFNDVITVDPYFKQAYRSAAFLTQLRPIPRTQAVKEAISFLDRGAQIFPQDWEFSFYAGANYLTDMPAQSKEEKQQNRRIAADYIKRAAVLGIGHGAPNWLPALAATVLTELGEQEVALRQLEDALLVAPDEATRNNIRGKIIQLKGRVEADRANAAVSEFLDRWAKNFPYVPLDLFVLLQDKSAGTAIDVSSLSDQSATLLKDPVEKQGE